MGRCLKLYTSILDEESPQQIDSSLQANNDQSRTDETNRTQFHGNFLCDQRNLFIFL